MRLDPKLDGEAAHALKADLVAAFAASPRLEVDAGAVRQLSQAALQVLIAAARSAGGGLTITGPSAPFLETVTMAGAANALGLAGDDQ